MYIENNTLRKYLINWLIGMCIIISIMIIVGGLTRLTDSGLSITQWQLFTGIIPENSCHSVIDKPESVSLVRPPTTIINEIIRNIEINQYVTYLFNILFSMYI